MQVVAPFDETVTISPSTTFLRNRKLFLIPAWLAFYFHLIMVTFGLANHFGLFALQNAAACMMFAAVIRMVRIQEKRKSAQPCILLTSDGITVDSIFRLGVIPWEEIAIVESGSCRGAAVVKLVPRNLGNLRLRMGAGGRYLCMYRAHGGGIGIPCAPYGISAKDMAANIDAYRQHYCPRYL